MSNLAKLFTRAIVRTFSSRTGSYSFPLHKQTQPIQSEVNYIQNNKYPKAMKKIILFFIVIISASSCQDSENIELPQECEKSFEITAPNGFKINLLETIEYNGNLIEIQFIDDMTGYILGSNNEGGYADIFKTIDGGKTWDNMKLILREIPRNMFFLNDNIGFITFYGSNGNLLKTTDGGENWDELSYNDLTGVMYHLQKDKENNIYSIISNANSNTFLLKSSDTAETWQVINDSPDLGFDLVTFSFKVYDENIYISGKNKEILITDLEGNLKSTIQTGIASIWDFEVIDGDNIIITGTSKTIESSDGGKNWVNIYDKSARLIDFSNSDEALMILNKSYCPSDVYQSNDVIGFTIDGGINWIESNPATNLKSNYSDHIVLSSGKYLILIGNSIYELIRK